MAKEEKKALFKEQKETLKSAQAAFSKFGIRLMKFWILRRLPRKL